MATTTASARLPASYSRFLVRPLGALATAAILAALGLAITIQFPQATPAAALVGFVILAIAAWMAFEERYQWSLVTLIVYLGLADGYLKLSTGIDKVTLVRDMLLYAIVAGALVRIAVRREQLALPPLAGWVIAWLVVVAIQVANPSNGTLYHSLAAIRPQAEWVPLFFIAYFVMRSKQRLRGFLLLLVFVAAVNGAVSLVQSNLTPDELAAWGPGYEAAIIGEGENSVSARGFADSSGEERNRPFALGGDSGFGGALGLIAVPAALGLLALSRRRGVRLLTILLSLGVVLAVATSASRTAVIGAVVAVFAFAALTVTSRAGLRTVFAVGLAATIAYASIGLLTSGVDQGAFDRYESISSPGEAVNTALDYRQETIARIPKYIVKYPLGSGFGRNGPAASLPGGPGPGLDSESEPTFLLIETGIPGLVVMFGFHLMLFYLAVTRIRRIRDREARILLTAVAAPLFALFVTWFVGVSTATTPGAPYLWFSAGVISFWLAGEGYRNLTRAPRSEEPAPDRTSPTLSAAPAG
ncbi:MAG TPA: O-antigen ligase family protein [Solirubrobacterales bacterium]|nr:O-antigen ligase family protein [Solirubrobacterales bacterium]